MSDKSPESLWNLMNRYFRAHPWHGVSIGEHAPDIVTVYVEMTPTDNVKYELDKESGLLKVDRPQRYSSVCPTLYGFVPQTYSGDLSAEFCREKTGRKNIVGDGDPLDICVLSEKPIRKSNVLLRAVPLGGLRMLDGDEADDKIIAAMVDDETFGDMQKIEECPSRLVDRMRHYFLTYKQAPDAVDKVCEITHIYGREEAQEVIRRAQEDYRRRYPDIASKLTAVLQG